MIGWTASALRDRLSGEDRERGSLPFLMLVMILSVALGAVLLTTVVSQARTSRFDESRIRSLDASQSGLDYALARIRGAVKSDDSSVGDAGKLPCFTTPAWTDASANGVQQFKVSVEYYRSNPSQLTTATRNSSRMTCSDAYGTYDAASNSRAPRYALITSEGRDTSRTGSGASKGRTLETTYVFQTNDVTISGGQFRIFPSGSTAYCMDAGAAPAVGTAVTLQVCSTSNPAADQQVFSYRSDLSIELVSTSNPPTPGLCLDTNPATHVANRPITLQRCSVADETPSDSTQTFVCPAGETPASFKLKNPDRTCRISDYNQQWSIDDNGHLRGALANQSDVDGFCIDAATQRAGQALLLQSCTGGTTDARQTWVPSPTAGAGAAGAGNNQIVNYAQFATCIDVTGNNVNATYTILYSCKQNPNSSKVSWNQKPVPSPALVQGPSTRRLITFTTGGTRYCLRSPLTLGGYPKLESCVTNPTADAFYWTLNQRYASNDSPATANELAYGERYTIKDSAGRCLGPGNNSDLHDGQYYKVVTAACDGSTAQKWNADPSRLKATLTNTREIG
ncbi:RICIN domain-containing protein [Solicola sp. PLA-1-18]|uniref:RICIN domain-containing protein n=1 Tax=Solicola sp. PLA-1-18 TaxID=3380532 RepID=UPI003B813E6B